MVAVAVAKTGDDIARNIDTIKAFREALDSGKGLDDLTDISRGFDSIDDETFEMALKNKQLISKLDGANPKDLKEALGGSFNYFDPWTNCLFFSLYCFTFIKNVLEFV